MPRTRSELGILAGAALASLLVPLLLSLLVKSRLDDAAAEWSRVLHARVTVASAEVDLSGALRLVGVRVGDTFAADAVEAGVALRSLLAGRFRADEVRVQRPTLRVRVDADGRVDLAALVARARDARRARHGAGPAGAGGEPVRRIVVTGGELELSIEGRGRIRARGVELHPQEAGVRVVAAGVSLALAEGPWRLDADFARTGLDVSLPDLQVERAVLAGGELRLEGATASQALVLTHAVVTRDASGSRLEARVSDAAGAPISAQLTHSDGGTRTLVVATTRLPLAAFAPALPPSLDFEHALASGRVTVRLHQRRVSIEGQASVQGLEARHAVLAKAAVPLSGSLSGEARWDADTRTGHARFLASSGSLRVNAELDVALTDERVSSGRLSLRLDEVACAEALAAVPLPLREQLDGLVLDGRLAGSLDLAFDASGVHPAVFDVVLDNRCRVIEDAPAAAVDRLQGAYTHTLPGGSTRTLAASDPGYVALAHLPAHVIAAFVAGEDARFFVHHGFDQEQLRRSFEIDMQSGRIERGGSTISQQLVKNLFLTRERTLSRKLLEAVLTWRLESRLSKRRILEAYLNVIELGDGIYGLEAGAQHWFGKPAARLDVAEAAFLAALTPAPQSSSRRILAAGGLDSETRGRVDAVLRSMWRNRFIDAGKLNHAIREPLALRVR